MTKEDIVIDCEIAHTIEETPGGFDATDKLGLACCVVYGYETNRYRVYGEKDVPKLREKILCAKSVTGFNNWKFDLPLIWGMTQKDFCATPEAPKIFVHLNDILRRIWIGCNLDPDVFTKDHKGWSLDMVAKGTLGKGKIGQGALAPIWWKEGRKLDVVNYCLDDVQLTRELKDHIDYNRFVVRASDSRKVVFS